MRILLCGFGVMGANHLRVLGTMSSECTVVGVVEPDEARHDSQAAPHATFYSSLSKALDETRPDAVIVATPTVTHAELGTEVLSRGIPLFMEKPIAKTAAEGEALVELAQKGNIPFMVGHIERFNPAIVAVHKLLHGGQLGDVISLSARRVGGTPRDIDKAGDVLVDLAVHDIDIATWLLGTPTLHSALGHKKRSIDSATMLFTCADTAIDIHVNWVTPIKIRELRVTGTQGHLDVNLITQQVSWIKQNPFLSERSGDERFFFDDYLLSFSTPDQISLGIRRREPLDAELRAFMAALRHAEPTHAIPVTGQDGVRALRLAEQARNLLDG